MKKLGLLVMPIMAISLLASCNNGRGADNPETYTITYENLLSTTTNNPTSYTDEDAFVFNDPIGDCGYKFTGWHIGGVTGELITEIKKGSVGNLILYASWGNVISYDITYYNLRDLGNNNPENYTVETGTITLSDPIGDCGYKFTGWHIGGVTGELITEIKKGSVGNLILYASWGNVISYDITYHNVDDTEHKNPKNYTIETDTITLDDAQRDGYTFLGWYTDNEFTDSIASIPKGSSGNLDIYAKFLVTYTITYHNVDDTEHNNPKEYTYETDTITLSDAQRNGYTFLGWYKDENLTNRVTSIVKGMTGNLHIYAKFNMDEYSITYYNLRDLGNNNPENYTVETDTITLSDPIGDCGYKFTGWHIGSKTGELITEIKKGSVGNLILYASWEKDPTIYNITYVLQGGQMAEGNPTVYDITKDVSITVQPTLEGFTFNGWFCTKYETNPLKDNGWEAGDRVGDITLYADWHITGKTLDNDYKWPQISVISNRDEASKYFDIGDTKTVTVNGLNHQVRIIGFSHDDLVDGNGKAGITFEFENIITDSNGAVTTNWNNKEEDESTNYDFPNSTINDFLNKNDDCIFNKLPSELKTDGIIKKVNKKVGLGESCSATSYPTKLFPLAHDEMTNHEDRVPDGEGTIYQYYNDHSVIEDRIKKDANGVNAENYWLRSPDSYLSYHAWFIDTDGDPKFNFIYYYEYAIAPAFCV